MRRPLRLGPAWKPPAAVMPEAQARLLASSEVVERVELAVADPGSRERLGRPGRV